MSAADQRFDLLDHALGRPLGYPGQAPRTSGLLVDDAFHEVLSPTDGSVGRWRVPARSASLDELMGAAGVAAIDARSPVLAIGSNASPAQLLRKFTTLGVSTVVPMTMATVTGLERAHSAHVSAAGYVPITPIWAADSRASFFVLWLDPDQVDALDRTEPNYDRCLLTDAHEATLESGERLPVIGLYVSRWGHLLSASGTALPPSSQRNLLASLLDRSSELRKLAGPGPEDFVSRAAASEDLRDEIRACFGGSGWVGTTSPFR
jgi:hypothetical protein